MKKFSLYLLVITGLIFFAGCTQQTQPANLDTFAQCLTSKGATMYGSKTCPHCLTQKAMFGESFQYITYVECTQEAERCTTLKGVPTREFKDGTQLLGLQEFTTLADKTGCPLQ